MWPTTSASSLEAPDTTEEDSLRLTTINTNEHEVANGFVKNGSSLPYVYETNDSGISYFFSRHLFQIILLQEIERDPPR